MAPTMAGGKGGNKDSCLGFASLPPHPLFPAPWSRLVSTPSQGFSLPAPRSAACCSGSILPTTHWGLVKFRLLRQQLWGGAESLHSHQARATLSSKAVAPGVLNIGNVTPEANLPPPSPSGLCPGVPPSPAAFRALCVQPTQGPRPEKT